MKAAIFDMDGTILDSMPFWQDVGGNYLRTQGREPRPGFRDTIKSMSMPEAAHYCKLTYDLPGTEEEIVAGMNAQIEGQYFHHLPLKPGAADFLRRLHGAGIRLCLATATDRYMAQAALERCGVLPLFDFVLTCTEVGAGKENPRIFEEALRRLGTSKAETWVFEDSPYAVETARAAGFLVAVVEDDSALAERPVLKTLAHQYLTSFADWRDPA